MTMTSMLNSIEGVSCVVPDGAFYCFPDVSGLLGREMSGRRATTSAELAESLLATVHVATVPGEAFGAPGHLRLSCAISDADLVEGVQRIAQFAAN
jgi:aspartate/methionine/tyrosine aminotransferase